MPRGLIRADVAAALLAMGVSNSARADVGDGLGTSTKAGSDQQSGIVSVGAALETHGGRQSSKAPPPKPLCQWASYVPSPEIPVDPAGALSSMLAQASANDATVYTKTCPLDVGTETTLVLVPNRVSVTDLVTSASSQVTAQLPDPTMDISPDPAVGGIVNVGLWLAVRDPGVVSITASVGPVWATVTAEYVGTSWTFGNGDAVSCDGLGTPIVDKNTADQGPCGYTYRWPSAPKFTGTDDLAYHASVTGHWKVTYATSTGGGGVLTPIDRTSPFTYQVREIQTVGVAGDD